jgi:hypothetical protein
LAIAEPPGSAAALAPQIGSLYQVAPTKGLSTLPPPLLALVLELVLEDEELLLDEELEELLEEDEELEELLLDEELLDDDEEVLDDELELEELELLPLIVPAEAVRVTRSSLAPSSRLLIRSV